MPLIALRCKGCKNVFTGLVRSNRERPPCPACGGAVRKVRSDAGKPRKPRSALARTASPWGKESEIHKGWASRRSWKQVPGAMRSVRSGENERKERE